MSNVFPEWLQEELNKRDWSQADLVRKSGLSQGSISHLISGTRGPGIETCQAIASAFDLSPETVLRAAGILDQVPAEQARFADWREILNQLTPEEEAELREIGLLKIKRREAARRLDQAKKQPPRDND